MAALREAGCQCCIAGAGPAGMMLGYLLSRAVLDVVVLEKHADFFRDFRGDTIHRPSRDGSDQVASAPAPLRSDACKGS
jgi:2-polyprenyl-6-methoxyphenol hydroxylase-like FAD-dependent oxidoreductase